MNRWLGDIRRYFPTPVVQLMQRDALERLGLAQLLRLRDGSAVAASLLGDCSKTMLAEPRVVATALLHPQRRRQRDRRSTEDGTAQGSPGEQ